jgi:hypothetical protein
MRGVRCVAATRSSNLPVPTNFSYWLSAVTSQLRQIPRRKRSESRLQKRTTLLPIPETCGTFIRRLPYISLGETTGERHREWLN